MSNIFYAAHIVYPQSLHCQQFIFSSRRKKTRSEGSALNCLNSLRSKRYLLQKRWDDSNLRLCIIMLSPSEAAGVALDRTTLLVLNNVSRLGYSKSFQTSNTATCSSTIIVIQNCV